MVGVLLMPSLLLAGCTSSGIETYVANMSGPNEVPPIFVTGSGAARLELDSHAQTIHFTVFANGMSSAVTAAQIHGPAGPGVTAGVIVTLFSGNAPPPVNGLLAQGTIGPASVDPASGLSWNQFTDLLKTEQTYVNIHTTGHPDGEVRGQLRLLTGIEGP